MRSLVQHGRRRWRPPWTRRTSPLFARGHHRDDDDERRSRASAVGRPRHYHATAQREILPFLAVGFVGATAVYTYRALQQTDSDWEEYHAALEDYKSATGIDPEKQDEDGATGRSKNASVSNNDAGDMSSLFTGGTLAIDLGSTRLKLSHRPSRTEHKNGKPPPPVVSVDREGFRSTPSLAWVPPANGGEASMLLGRLAEARSYDAKGGTLVRPREALAQEDAGTDTAAAVREVIRDGAADALDQVLGATGGASTRSETPLFVLDAAVARGGAYNVRPIFTYPPHDTAEAATYLERYQHAVRGLTSPWGIAAFVPEPVAAVVGAEYYDLLPPKTASGGTSVLVIDVGGTSTSLSMVGGGDDAAEMLHSTTLPSFGGDTFIDLLVGHLADGFYDNSEAGRSSEATTLSSKPNLSDPMALQRLYEASTTAVHELSNKSRCEINVPYLTMDVHTRAPRHLEMGVARTVVEAEVEAWVRERLVPYLHTNDTDATALSPSLPPPTDLSSLFSSAIMAALERTAHAPPMLRAVLVVGGGARVPAVRKAIEEGASYLGGERSRTIVPAGEMAAELSVLGAAVWGSQARAT